MTPGGPEESNHIENAILNPVQSDILVMGSRLDSSFAV